MQTWLLSEPPAVPASSPLKHRTQQLMELGFRNFDALHLASAEQAGADVFVTCDDRLLRTAGTTDANTVRVRVVGILDLAKELLP